MLTPASSCLERTAAGSKPGSGSGPSTYLLRPGIYYIVGGGLDLKSNGSRVVSIPASTATCGLTLCDDVNVRTRYATASTVLDADLTARWEARLPATAGDDDMRRDDLQRPGGQHALEDERSG